MILKSCQEYLRPLMSITSINFLSCTKLKKKITLDKCNDLQNLKSIMPYDCHSFYDGLPHMETSTRKEKSKRKTF